MCVALCSRENTYLERTEQALIYTHHGTSVVEFTAIIRRAEQGYKLSFGKELVTILNNLVGAADEIHVVFLEEAADNVWSKGKGDATVILRPAGDVLVRIRPK